MEEPSVSSSTKKSAPDGLRNSYGGRSASSDIIKRFNSVSNGKRKLTDKNTKQIDELLNKGFTSDNILDGLIKYEDVLNNHGSGITFAHYMRAIEFVGYVVGGSSYKKAYKLTFPLKAENMDGNNLNVSASRYANSTLVKNMLERIYLNQHIFFIDKTIQAKLELYRIGMGDGYEKDKINALDKFLTHTTKYEEKAGLTVNNFSSGSQTVNIVNAIDGRLSKLAEVAQLEIEKGTHDAKSIAEAPIIMVEEEA